MGAFLLAAGTKGKRYALPNSRMMLHQPSGGSRGVAADIEIQAREILSMRKRLNEILASHTGQTVDRIAEDTDPRLLDEPGRSGEVRFGGYRETSNAEARARQ